MDQEVKKGIMLLKSLIFHYHGLDDEEKVLLEEAAKKYDAFEALEWSTEFISEDYMSAFERAKEFLSKAFSKLDEEAQLQYLIEVWEENHQKGYVTEMETTAIINLAKDWQMDVAFLKYINH
ncbi:MAG: hypothetical protein ACJA08_001346 [Cyclobacteriaceae bacterium]|jgi:hypothetical protein